LLPKKSPWLNLPIGGLDRQACLARLAEVYVNPVELYYGEAVMLLDPSEFFHLDLDSMLTDAAQARTQQSLWEGFLKYLWSHPTQTVKTPLKAFISENRLRRYLVEEVAARYDQPSNLAIPRAGTLNLRPGKEGTSLDIDRSIPLIEEALRSPTNRVVELPLLHMKVPQLMIRQDSWPLSQEGDSQSGITARRPG
jgi:hypothetical protein